jgi:hypothetical protein
MIFLVALWVGVTRFIVLGATRSWLVLPLTSLMALFNQLSVFISLALIS